MSLIEESVSNYGVDSNDQQVLSLPHFVIYHTNFTQPVFIFTRHEEAGRPPKRQKVGKAPIMSNQENASVFHFEPLLGGLEASEFVQLRMELYNQLWGATENRIQVRNGNGGINCMEY